MKNSKGNQRQKSGELQHTKMRMTSHFAPLTIVSKSKIKPLEPEKIYKI